MTKQLLKGLYAVGLLAVLAVSATPAWAADVKCQIPFAFTVSDKTLPAGSYHLSTSQSVLTVRGSGSGVFVMTNRVESAANRQPSLVFHRYGDTYVLREAWTGGNSGRELPRPRREFTRRGAVATSFERVEVPLL